MKGTDEAALNLILLILLSWAWVPVLLICLLAALLIWLGERAAGGLGRWLHRSPLERERSRINSERDASFARIDALGYEAEVRMLQAARGDLDVAIGSAAQEPEQ
jgi:hypothetical protein